MDKEELGKIMMVQNSDSLLGDMISVPGTLIDLATPIGSPSTAATPTPTLTLTPTLTPTPPPTPNTTPLSLSIQTTVTARTKTQEAFFAYKNSLFSVKSKLSENLGAAEIKCVTNLAGSVIKTILIFLTYFERNEKATKLLQILLIHSNDFGPAAKIAAYKPDDKSSVQGFIEILTRMITAIEDHIDYLT